MPIGQTNILRASRMGSAKSPSHTTPVRRTEIATAGPYPWVKSCSRLWYSPTYNKALPLLTKKEFKTHSEQRINENNAGYDPRVGEL